MTKPRYAVCSGKHFQFFFLQFGCGDISRSVWIHLLVLHIALNSTRCSRMCLSARSFLILILLPAPLLLLLLFLLFASAHSFKVCSRRIGCWSFAGYERVYFLSMCFVKCCWWTSISVLYKLLNTLPYSKKFIRCVCFFIFKSYIYSTVIS